MVSKEIKVSERIWIISWNNYSLNKKDIHSLNIDNDSIELPILTTLYTCNNKKKTRNPPKSYNKYDLTFYLKIEL